MPQNEKGGRIEEQAQRLVQDIIKDAGFELWDVIYEKEGAMWYLKILFDTSDGIKNPGGENGISSEDCEKITVPINAVIDKQKFVDKIDILEIGSPGLTRRLRNAEHFNACMGKSISAALRDEKGKTVYKKGTLSGFDETNKTFYIDNDNDNPISIKKCIKINLYL